jgi:hypothetical protein
MFGCCGILAAAYSQSLPLFGIAGCMWLQTFYMYGIALVFESMAVAVTLLGVCRNVCFSMFVAVY